jgi:hypothetical protein
MPNTRTMKQIFKWSPLTKVSQERPTYMWEDNIKEDICQLRVKNWIVRSRIEDIGKRSLTRTKLSTIKQEVQCLKKKRIVEGKYVLHV